MIYIYEILGFILIPFIKLNVKFRIKQGKENSKRYKERFGYSSYSATHNKKVIWIHAASLGEFKAADFLINKYHKKFTLLITTTTLSSSEYAIKKYGNKIIHQFAPLDVNIWVKRFIKKWNPKFVIWIESDLWPTTLKNIKKNKVKAILINLRLSPKSLKKWKFVPFFYDSLLSSFSKIFVQSEEDKKRVQLLTNKNIEFIGNLKLENKIVNLKENEKINFLNNSNLICIMLTSTHKNEESLLLPIYKELLSDNKNLYLIIAPRHPERSKEIMLLCDSHNLASQLESEKKINNKKILIIDSFGILSNYFAISDVVFLGGSLIPAGGHNPIEPAIHNCAIISGDLIFNWKNIFDDMVNKNACLKVKNIDELKNNLKNLIQNKNKRLILQNNAYNFAKKQFVDTNYLEKTINNYIN